MRLTYAIVRVTYNLKPDHGVDTKNMDRAVTIGYSDRTLQFSPTDYIYPEETHSEICQLVWEAQTKPHIKMTNRLNNNTDQRAAPLSSALRWKTSEIPPGEQ